jgi:hypothetical protein
LCKLHQYPARTSVESGSFVEAEHLDDFVEVFLLEGQERIEGALLAHLLFIFSAIRKQIIHTQLTI